MMTYDEAIKKLLKSCSEYEETIKLLEKENAFLVDTIEKYNLGKISRERKSLYKSMEQVKKDAALILKEANSIKSQYLGKLKETEFINRDLKDKQNNLDMYIDSQSDVKSKEIKEKFSNYKVFANEKINSCIQENMLLKSQNASYSGINRKLKILIGILIGVLVVEFFVLRGFGG